MLESDAHKFAQLLLPLRRKDTRGTTSLCSRNSLEQPSWLSAAAKGQQQGTAPRLPLHVLGKRWANASKARHNNSGPGALPTNLLVRA